VAQSTPTGNASNVTSGTAAGNFLLDQAPSLPGVSSGVRPVASSAHGSSNSNTGGKGQAHSSSRGAGRPANAWTGQLDSRTEAAAAQLATAPELDAEPKESAVAPASRAKPTNTNTNKPHRERPPQPQKAEDTDGDEVIATPAPPAAAADATQPAPAAAAGGRGRGRGRGAPVERPPVPEGAIGPYVEVDESRDPAADILSIEDVRSSFQPAEIVSVSKKLSQLLRHGAIEQGFPISRNGYVPLSALLAHPKFRQVTRAVIAKVVVENGKQRFKLAYGKKDGQIYLRANQGHSMEGIEVDMHKLTDPGEVPVAIHGTRIQVWPAILKDGLNRMGRQHVHMALDVPGSGKVVSGARSSSTCLIYVDIAAMVQDGLEVLVSSNGVVLSAGVNGVIPAQYFIRATDNQGNLIWSRA
jgi:2'-phosphotransferase